MVSPLIIKKVLIFGFLFLKFNMSKKILFIEDEFALQRTIGELLRKEGYEVFSSLDGKSGVEIAKKEKPDLILLDLILPHLSGFEVLEELKKEESTKEIPVIVLTNLEGLEDVQRALELGALFYLVKSNYTPQEIVEKVNEFFK